jgi:membrane protease YdiL (CAAX protease family)
VKPIALFVQDGGVRTPWRIAFFLIVTLAAGTATAGIIYPVIAATPLVSLARQWNVPLDQFGALLALLAGTWASLRIVDGATTGAWARVGLGASALSWRTLATGLAAGTLAILVPSALLLASGRLRLEPQPAIESWAQAARAALFLLVPAALVEEIALRGYLLSTLRDAIRAPGAVAVTSVLFALLHLFNPGPTILSTAVVALAGVFLATVRLVTGSLYAAWIAHFVWNFAQAAVLHAPVSGLALPTPGYRLADRGPEWLTGGSWGPEGGLAAAAGMLVATFLLVWRPRKGARTKNGEPGESSPRHPWRPDA